MTYRLTVLACRWMAGAYLLSMRSNYLLILLLAFIPMLRTVAEEVAIESAPFEMKDAIQPRAEGAEWLYASTMHENGKWSPAGSAREDVQAVVEIDGVPCYKIQLTVDWRSLMDRLAGVKLTEEDYSYYWEYANAQGSYNYSGGDTEEIHYPAPTSLDQFELTLPYPVEKGHSYVAEDEKYTVIATDETIKVPAGEFACAVYQISYEDDPEYITRQRLFMAKGVGLVRWEEDEKVDGEWQPTYRDDLIRYDMKTPAVEVQTWEAEKGASPESAAPVSAEATAE